MKVLALSKYSYSGPSSRYRVYNFQQCFRENGIRLFIKPFFPDSYLGLSSKFRKIPLVLYAYVRRIALVFGVLFFKKKYDLVYIEYELLPFFPAFFERLLKLRKIKYIVDYDDAIFHKYDSHRNSLVRLLLKNKISRVMQLADTVIVGNQYLAEYAKKQNNKVIIFPTVVLLEKYENSAKKSIYKESENFIIGWIGSKSTSKYILEILPVMQEFATLHNNVQFHFIGFDKSLLSEKDIMEYRINIIPWSEESEIGEMMKFDIGIMPLTDDPWSRGKCGFKLIQYMSCGKPVVASPVGENVNIVTQYENGFLATSKNDWMNAFENLLNDKVLYSRIAENNKQKIKRNYNHEQICLEYQQLIKGIVDTLIR